ncbi:mitochondrial antiviral-signaling protein isoform X1 [Strigops habroptila]|uniref:Mitochondrial antiviral signaling protein n=1 Tax=Strigops habroptila TaxID=2489341 RepID=A0A672VD96_STRHB|nr:mitochondrial antiviral-signaling protein isoform X1 [Strigops habroptila]XP_030347441.1 mitochondrial antiviral-signaling protein isoform X1 [Strigops habroptila]XP_030347442.1 mitochondrial antiviral-signaling protein isoform X1 [Strigops habroptila]XP_030347443.1 mitochondrial antiviral-signaling protein isoform X1 [Strigops habroptila]
MGFAEEKVYDYIMKNLRNFRNIRVASLADSLSCLTDADRDELHAREEARGSQATVYRFYQHLKCRQGWVRDLIEALRQNNAGDLADELQHVYDSWQACPPAPTTASSPPAASNARPTVTSTAAQTLSPAPNPAPGAPLAEQPHRDLPGAATTMSTDLDARTPVQESLPKTLKQETSRPSPPGSTVHDGVSTGHGAEGHLSHPIEAVQAPAGTPGTGSMSVPSAVPSECGRDWLSRPQHPVCVDNGCFGNANHLRHGAPSLGLGRPHPPRGAEAAHSPRNEPQEDLYISTESPPTLQEAARSGGMQPLISLPPKQAVSISEHGEHLGSFVDVRSPLLIQQQFDAEQKLVGMLGEHGREGADTWMESATLVTGSLPRGTSPSCDTSLKPPGPEKKAPMEVTATSTPSVPPKEHVLLASADPPLGTTAAGSVSGRTSHRVSSATTIWASCSNVEGDVEPSKPGVLLSVAGASPEAGGRCPSGPSSSVSNSLTFRSDPLLVSTESSSSGQALPRASLGCPAPDAGEEASAGASRDSHPLPSWSSTHEVHVEQHPSAQLEAGSDLQDRANPIGNSGFDSVTGLSQGSVPSGDSSGPSLSYLIPTVGIAVVSMVAFLVCTRWHK